MKVDFFFGYNCECGQRIEMAHKDVKLKKGVNKKEEMVQAGTQAECVKCGARKWLFFIVYDKIKNFKKLKDDH